MISNGSETNVEKKLETNGSSETMTEPDSAAASNSISSSSQDDVKRIGEFFETNASAIEKWLCDVAPEQVIAQISNVVSKRKPSCEREHRSSVTSELYQQWLSSSSSPTKKVSWSVSIEWQQRQVEKMMMNSDERCHNPDSSSFSFSTHKSNQYR